MGVCYMSERKNIYINGVELGELFAESVKQGIKKYVNDTLIRPQIAERELERYFNGEGITYTEEINRLKCDRYFDILTFYFGQGLTIEQIADKFGVSTQTISTNKKRLLNEFAGCIKI